MSNLTETDELITLSNLSESSLSSISSSIDSTNSKQASKRGKNKIYYLCETFETIEEAEAFINDEKIWRYKITYPATKTHEYLTMKK